MKLNKAHICTALQIGYHVLFLGGGATLGNHYLEEIEKTRQTIVEQVDKARSTVDKVRKTGDDINGSVRDLEKQLKKVKKACGRFL